MRYPAALLLLALTPLPLAAQALRLEPLPPLPVADAFEAESAPENLSGAGVLEVAGKRYLAVVVDEGTQFALVEQRPGKSPWGAVQVFDLRDLLPERRDLSDLEEIDLEGVAVDGTRLYLAGSASMKRSKPKKGESDAKNRKRLAQIESPGGDYSDYVYVLDVAAGKKGLAVELADRVEVRRLHKKDDWVGPFFGLPSKDNGFDVEGLEVGGNTLMLGLRGPVLRGHAVVSHVKDGEASLSFLHLQGLGIRAMTRATTAGFGEGVFLLAGPTMEQDFPFALYRWDGVSDSFDGAPKGLAMLGWLKTPCEGCKPEGLWADGDELRVLFDGPKGGAPHRLLPPARGR